MAEPLRNILPQDGEIQKPELALLTGEAILDVGHIAAEGSVVDVIQLPVEESYAEDVGYPYDYMPPGYRAYHWTTADDINLKSKTGKTRQRDYWYYGTY